MAGVDGVCSVGVDDGVIGFGVGIGDGDGVGVGVGVGDRCGVVLGHVLVPYNFCRWYFRQLVVGIHCCYGVLLLLLVMMVVVVVVLVIVVVELFLLYIVDTVGNEYVRQLTVGIDHCRGGSCCCHWWWRWLWPVSMVFETKYWPVDCEQRI